MTGITTVNLGGQQRTLSFKNNFFFLLGVTAKCDPMDTPDLIEDYCKKGQVIRALTIIIYCAMVAEFERHANYEHGLTIEQVALWCDEADQKEFITVWDMFAQIMDFPKASEDQIKAYEAKLKKKETLTTKNRKNTEQAA